MSACQTVNAYEIKTGLSRAKLSRLMDGETWMNAQKAVELGFADGILYDRAADDPETTRAAAEEGYAFSRRAVTNCLLDKLRMRNPKPAQPGIRASDLEKRLALLK